jgi:integrase
MLKLWRRHVRDCKYDSREDKRCACPIFSEWRVDGKRIRKQLNTGDWRVAETRARDWEIAGIAVSGVAMTIDSAFERFISNARARNLQESTIRKHDLMRRQLQEFCEKRGLVFLGQLNVDQLTQFRATWKLCPRTAAKALERLRSFFKFCVRSKWISENPASDIDPPKVQDAEVLPFSNEEVTAILKACDSFNGNGPRIKALAQFMLLTGLRISDAATITRAAFIEDQKGAWSVVLRTQKTGTSVRIPLPPGIAKSVFSASRKASILEWREHAWELLVCVAGSLSQAVQTRGN